jgi:two-component system, OmpR family, response regulator
MPKVLLIEDDRETAHEITAELVHRGFDVDWAGTGIERVSTKRVPPTRTR